MRRLIAIAILCLGLAPATRCSAGSLSQEAIESRLRGSAWIRSLAIDGVVDCVALGPDGAILIAYSGPKFASVSRDSQRRVMEKIYRVSGGDATGLGISLDNGRRTERPEGVWDKANGLRLTDALGRPAGALPALPIRRTHIRGAVRAGVVDDFIMEDGFALILVGRCFAQLSEKEQAAAVASVVRQMGNFGSRALVAASADEIYGAWLVGKGYRPKGSNVTIRDP